MTVAEPATLVTDYLLGALSGVCGALLLRRNALQQASIRLWALALCAVAAASFAGGTFHGFLHELSAGAAAVLWKVTTISMGVASFFLLTAAFNAAFSGSVRSWLISAAALKLAIYLAWMLGHDEFRFVIFDYGSTLMILLLMTIAGKTHGTAGHRAYIVSGVLASIAAAAVQQSGVRLHRYFNHNDLMHVVQMAGIWLLYAGGSRLRDAGGSHDGQP